MNIFKFYQLLKSFDLFKITILALFAALTPWAIVYVVLPAEYQKHHLIVYGVSSVILAFGMLRIYYHENKQTDADLKSAESLFESMSNMSSTDPQVRKRAATQMVQQLQAIESDEEGDKISEEQRQKNLEGNFRALRKLAQICQNLGLKVRTNNPEELRQIAEDFNHSRISKKQALVELLVDHQASLWVEMEDFEGVYAQVLEDIVNATQTQIEVKQMTVYYDESSSDCMVSFVYEGQRVKWKFRQKGHYVAQNFLNKALQFFGEKADGKFVFIDSEDAYADYLFIPNVLYKKLKS